MKMGTHVRSNVALLLTGDSYLPLWETPALMDAAMTGEGVTTGTVSGWMTPTCTATIIGEEPRGRRPRYTPLVQVLLSNGSIGWCDSMYLVKI